jgi:hypothetical protein
MHVMLAPDRVSYRIQQPLRGVASATGVIDCTPDDSARPWRNACAALAAFISDRMQRHMRLDVVVSDRLVRYQVLPWREGIVSRVEWRAYAQHSLEAVYGEASKGWRLRIDLVPPGRPSLACAIDSELVEVLRNLGADCGSRLTGVRPNFVTLFNQRRPAMRGSGFWFGVVENGNVSLGVMIEGSWRALRNEATADTWPVALAGMIRRTQVMLPEPCAGTLYLCGDIDNEALPDSIGGLPLRLFGLSLRRPQPAEAAVVSGG